MTREELEILDRKASLICEKLHVTPNSSGMRFVITDEIQRCIMAERARCAKIAEQRYLASDQPSNFVANVRKFHGEDIAAAIRGA